MESESIEPSQFPEPLPTFPVAPTPTPTTGARQREVERGKRRRWLEQKRQVLEALRDLRAEQEDDFLHSPHLGQTAIYRAPAPQDIPHAPAGREPTWDNESEKAKLWRRQSAERERLTHWRAEIARSHRLRPFQTWPLALGSERGGKRPGEHAYPPAWNGYLLRVDPEGPGGGGWASPLGVAFKRIELSEGESLLFRTLWRYTDPALPLEGVARLQDVAQALDISPRSAYRWLDAAAARMVAEVAVIVRGNAGKAQQERATAERAEADAWQQDCAEQSAP